MYFTVPETGAYLSIDGDRKYHAASTVKAIYCQYLLERGVDLSEALTLTEVNRLSTSGKLTSSAVGQAFTVAELMEYAICQSDNQAYYLLYETYGWEGFNRYTAAIGIPEVTLGDESEWAIASARELSLAMAEIDRASSEDDTLLRHLKNTDYNSQISAGTAYEVAHKYGYNGDGRGYHDTAIVYAPGGTYILTVMSNASFADGGNPDALFRAVAALCDSLWEALSAPVA